MEALYLFVYYLLGVAVLAAVWFQATDDDFDIGVLATVLVFALLWPFVVWMLVLCSPTSERVIWRRKG